MRSSPIIVSTLLIGLSVYSGLVRGQEYPNRPIRIITAPPGGSADFISRIIAQELTTNVGWQVVVENRPSGIVGEVVAKANPDGTTLGLAGGNLWLTPFLEENVRYDPIKDFAPITYATNAPNILVVHPSLPVRSVREMITLARHKPGALNYAVSGWGDSAHLAAELFKAMAAVNIVRIEYRGSGLALLDLIRGQVQLAFASAGGATPHLKSGKLRGLAVTSASPSALFPDMPTLSASGLPGYEAGSKIGVFAPAKTPEVIITRLSHEMVRVLRTPSVKEKLLYSGVEAVGGSQVDLAITVKADMAKWGKVIKDLGIRPK